MTTDTVGGVWTYSLDLARALAAYDIEVHLATMGAPLSTDQWADASSLPNVTVHESYYKLEWMPEAWDDVRDSGVWLRGLASRVRPNLVHLNGYAHGALDWDVPAVVVGHSCVLSWWEAVKHEPAPAAEWDRYRIMVRRGLKSAMRVVAPSAAMLSCLQKHYGPLVRTSVIHNGRTAALYRVATKAPFVLAAGRIWDEAKNITALERVAPTLHWPVCVAGDNAHPAGGEETNTKNLRHLGKLSAEALAEEMSHASIYALPARYEPFGLSALEAALSGCALVLGDISSLREVWGSAAVYVDPDDHHALAIAIEDLIANPTMRSGMANRVTARAARYSLGRMGAAYMELYRELVPRRFVFLPRDAEADEVAQEQIIALPQLMGTELCGS